MEAKIKMKQIDAALLQKMLIGGAKRLEANKEYINELNVFLCQTVIQERI